MNPINIKEDLINKKNIKFLLSILVLIAILSGCESASREELKREREQLFIVPSGAGGKVKGNYISENSHVVKASDYHAEYKEHYLRSTLLTLNPSAKSIGLVFDLSSLPQNMKIKKATLGLYRIELLQSKNLYVKNLKITNPEYLFNYMVLGNVNSAYGYVKSRKTISDYGNEYIIEEAQIQDKEENILKTLVKIGYVLSDKEHIKLADSTRQISVWHTGETLKEGGLTGWAKEVKYRDLINYFMEDKIYRAWHEGKWDFFDVTKALERDYKGDKKLLLVLMQYPTVYKKDVFAKIPIVGNAYPVFFNITWASPKNTSDVVPQIIVEFDTDATVLRPKQDEPKSTDTKSLLKEKLGKLKELLDEGIITKEEYESKRKSIIDKLFD